MCLRSDTELRCKNGPVLNSVHASFQGEEDQCLQQLRRDAPFFSEVEIFQFRVILLRRASFRTYSKISRGRAPWGEPLRSASGGGTSFLFGWVSKSWKRRSESGLWESLIAAWECPCEGFWSQEQYQRRGNRIAVVTSRLHSLTCARFAQDSSVRAMRAVRARGLLSTTVRTCQGWYGFTGV